MSEAFDIPRSTCNNLVHWISSDIQQVFWRFIRLPNRDELEEIGAGFQQLAGHPAFCEVAGSIDGCHFRIMPPGQFGADFFNRKLFHPVQFQAIVDHKGSFLDVHVSFPGSVQDSRVLREHLRNPTQERFSARHSWARSVVERAFGVLKTRWRSIFLKALEVKVDFVSEVIVDCLFLHNLCLGHRDVWSQGTVKRLMGMKTVWQQLMTRHNRLVTPSGIGWQQQYQFLRSRSVH
ncbi:putative nuclease HARBI1 [Xyrichtys novacula]|uniref:Nuclease HARBI1 n=1 Tax=Xyrichtys novacula TaxID=13765 RepID=A0AAV1FWQ5_XYRNO|nr:putative nuclease HARBI1 [Xyrichtys novacula]